MPGRGSRIGRLRVKSSAAMAVSLRRMVEPGSQVMMKWLWSPTSWMTSTAFGPMAASICAGSKMGMAVAPPPMFWISRAYESPNGFIMASRRVCMGE